MFSGSGSFSTVIPSSATIATVFDPISPNSQTFPLLSSVATWLEIPRDSTPVSVIVYESEVGLLDIHPLFQKDREWHLQRRYELPRCWVLLHRSIASITNSYFGGDAGLEPNQLGGACQDPPINHPS